MCFQISQHYPNAMTSNRDILAFKVGEPKGMNEFVSSIMGHRYVVGEALPHVPLIAEDREIYAGYHLYSTYEEALLNVHISHLECIQIFLIPKGAKYYFNPDHNELVATDVVYKGRYTEETLSALMSGKKLSSWKRFKRWIKNIWH